MNTAIFAPTEITFKQREVMARNISEVRAFFMPSYQVSQDIAVACRFEREPIFPHLISSLCDVISVGGNGGNRFLIWHQLTEITMHSKSTPQVGYTPAQLNVINLYLEPEKAASTARALRMLCISALEHDDGHNPHQIADLLFLAELLLDVATMPTV